MATRQILKIGYLLIVLGSINKNASLTQPVNKIIATLNYSFLGKYWPVVKRYASHIGKSMAEAQKIEKEEAETVNALASLSMQSVVKEPKRYVERFSFSCEMHFLYLPEE